MHAARGRLPCGNVFGFVYAIPGVCRGGIYASRQGCAPRGVCGKTSRFPRFVGRGLDPAAPMIFQNNFYNVRRARSPALQGKNKHQTDPVPANAAPFRGPQPCGPYNVGQTPYNPYPGGGLRRGQDPALPCEIHTTPNRERAVCRRALPPALDLLAERAMIKP